MRTVIVLGLASGMMLLMACSTRTSQSDRLTIPSSQPVAVISTPKQSDAITYPIPAPAIEVVSPDLQQGRRPSVHKPKLASPAILALMTQANQSQSLNQLDTAAATLERALRIQPRSAELWSRLAHIRLRQQRVSLAENLAKKSNVLATGSPAIMSRNWAIIARSKKQQGDTAGAIDADRKAAYYKRLAES